MWVSFEQEDEKKKFDPQKKKKERKKSLPKGMAIQWGTVFRTVDCLKATGKQLSMYNFL